MADEQQVPPRMWIDWANVDSRKFYYVRPTGIEVEAIPYVPESVADERVRGSRAENLGYGDCDR